jgi:hypothetical protein
MLLLRSLRLDLCVLPARHNAPDHFHGYFPTALKREQKLRFRHLWVL